ncbi:MULTISPECIES: heme exporter protein CcmD [unclassified Vreelandella]
MMAFTSLTEFFAMGGHGVYVWSAWGVTALLLLLCLLQARLERRGLVKAVRRRARRERARAQNGPRSSSHPGGNDDA